MTLHLKPTQQADGTGSDPGKPKTPASKHLFSNEAEVRSRKSRRQWWRCWSWSWRWWGWLGFSFGWRGGSSQSIRQSGQLLDSTGNRLLRSVDTMLCPECIGVRWCSWMKLVNCPTRWSLSFIFVFLCWSSTSTSNIYFPSQIQRNIVHRCARLKLTSQWETVTDFDALLPDFLKSPLHALCRWKLTIWVEQWEVLTSRCGQTWQWLDHLHGHGRH